MTICNAMNHPIIMTVTKEEEAELLQFTHGGTPEKNQEPHKPVGKVKYEVKKPDFVPSSRVIGL